MPHISVIICAYTEERWDDLVAAVESVHRQTIPPLEVIVVVDHNAVLQERVRASLSGVVIVENDQPRGLSGARNSGIAVARGDVLAFLDDDAIADPNWLEYLSSSYADDRVFGVGGAIIPAWPDMRPLWFPEEFDWVVGCTYKGMPTTASLVRNLIGANMSFRSVVFQEVGGFSSDIGRVGTRPLGCEETELCIRVRQHWRDRILLYQPQAKVYHRVSPNRTHWKYFFSRCYSEGLSKATIAKRVGAGDGLSSERAYTFRTLPKGVVRGLVDSILHLRPAGVTRSAAIVSGLTVTTIGYIAGSLSSRRLPFDSYRRALGRVLRL